MFRKSFKKKQRLAIDQKRKVLKEAIQDMAACHIEGDIPGYKMAEQRAIYVNRQIIDLRRTIRENAAS